jgi:hypothetical protein
VNGTGSGSQMMAGYDAMLFMWLVGCPRLKSCKCSARIIPLEL